MWTCKHSPTAAMPFPVPGRPVPTARRAANLQRLLLQLLSPKAWPRTESWAHTSWAAELTGAKPITSCPSRLPKAAAQPRRAKSFSSGLLNLTEHMNPSGEQQSSPHGSFTVTVPTRLSPNPGQVSYLP